MGVLSCCSAYSCHPENLISIRFSALRFLAVSMRSPSHHFPELSHAQGSTGLCVCVQITACDFGRCAAGRWRR